MLAFDPQTAAPRVPRGTTSLALIVGFALLASTCGPARRWLVGDEKEVAVPPRPEASGRHRVARMKLHVEAPKGTWPIEVAATRDDETAVIWFAGADSSTDQGSVLWSESCADIQCKPIDGEHSPRDAARTACSEGIEVCGSPVLELECDQKHCSVDIELELHVRESVVHASEAPVRPQAYVGGSLSSDGLGCQSKDSSTDLESAPDDLSLTMEVGELEQYPEEPAMPDDDSEGPYTPAPYPNGVDAGALDAGAWDAGAPDAGVLDASLPDGAVTDAGDAGAGSRLR